MDTDYICCVEFPFHVFVSSSSESLLDRRAILPSVLTPAPLRCRTFLKSKELIYNELGGHS